MNPSRNRIWAHAVRSLPMLDQVARGFGGFEVDLLFEGDPATFHLRRPSGLPTGLLLEDVLEATRTRLDLHLWLDWKNATPALFEPALGRLAELDRRFDLAGRTLVETGSEEVFPELRRLGELGLEHGYYLPTMAVLETLSFGSEEGASFLGSEIERRVELGGFRAVTFDWRLRPFVGSRLEPFLERRGLARYAWDLDVPPVAAADGVPAEVAWRIGRGGLEALLVPVAVT